VWVLGGKAMKLRHAAALALVGGLAFFAFRETGYPDFAPSFLLLIILALIKNLIVAIPFGIAAWLTLRSAGDQWRKYLFVIIPLTIIALGRTLDLAIWAVRMTIWPPP
jgi:hypothetical protein